MQKFKMIIRIVVFVLLGSLLHYVLPGQDVGRITGTDTIRQDFGRFNRIFFAQADSGSAEAANRDVLFIDAVRRPTYLFGLIRGSEVNDVMIYRNEDTGFIWPPYFKFDTRDLQGEAKQLVSTAEAPKWVVITHYGWRNRFLTIFPNAISIREIDSPDYRPIPWVNIAFFIFLMVALMFVRAAWAQFRERSVDPLMDAAGDQLDEVQAGVAEQRGRLRRWLDTWRSKK
ncbi:DUF1523 family protein [Yoonia sediminilitoris]|uniref:Uncharacterized protein DUF1523 n=1 Tax=Yoonia sediminilitoris TaxID=1286148 RepID=A0A2T6KFN9_9RHOB|nr:DUF1523 family protein [Yoonia sediminilitoris]PUB14137.1 uncharacterized protein DUF1523 [Yoonia sediminilitoris]RCW95068.1 uncharacterized protein DUF1523 [Yoonia sediminilitoris]